VVEYQFVKEILADLIMIVYQLEAMLVVENVHPQVQAGTIVVGEHLIVEV
jgi:hypothetical protein